MERKYPEIKKYSRILNEKSRKWNALDNRALRLLEQIGKLEKTRNKLIEQYEASEDTDHMRSEIEKLRAEAESIQNLTRLEDDEFTEPLAAFIYHAMKIVNPELSEEEFYDQMAIEDMAAIHSRFRAQKKMDPWPTPAMAYISVETIRAIPEDEIRNLAPQILGMKSDLESSSNTFVEPDKNALDSVSENY